MDSENIQPYVKESPFYRFPIYGKKMWVKFSLMGRNIQRDYGQEPQLTLFMPLLEGIDGIEKMSKSLGNYIGIHEEPHIIYEKVMRIPDSMIIKYYNLCTDIHPDAVNTICQRLDSGENPRDIKMDLAFIITCLYCGKESATNAQNRFISVFQKNEIPNDTPEIKITAGKQPHGEQIAAALLNAGIYKSKSEIRRVFQQGGAQLDGVKIIDMAAIFINDEAILKLGKNKIYKIVCS